MTHDLIITSLPQIGSCLPAERGNKNKGSRLLTQPIGVTSCRDPGSVHRVCDRQRQPHAGRAIRLSSFHKGLRQKTGTTLRHREAAACRPGKIWGSRSGRSRWDSRRSGHRTPHALSLWYGPLTRSPRLWASGVSASPAAVRPCDASSQSSWRLLVVSFDMAVTAVYRVFRSAHDCSGGYSRSKYGTGRCRNGRSIWSGPSNLATCASLGPSRSEAVPVYCWTASCWLLLALLCFSLPIMGACGPRMGCCRPSQRCRACCPHSTPLPWMAVSPAD